MLQHPDDETAGGGGTPLGGSLNATAERVRREVLDFSHHHRTPHLGSSLSCVELVTAALFGAMRVDPAKPDDPHRDRLILSKGHAATTLYAGLHQRGFLSDELAASYARPGSLLPEHPVLGSAPGIEATTGSLGHGLGLGCGLALGSRIRGLGFRVFVILSDGECNEGSVWEAALFGAGQRLSNLVALIDFNRWQATDRSPEVLALEPLAAKWEAFGWQTHEVDGHDVEAVAALLRASGKSGAPTAIVAHTVKGKGISFMEDDNNWHYRIPNPEEYAAAVRELEG